MNRVEGIVSRIIDQVRRGGDTSLVRLTLKYDGVRLGRGKIRVGKQEVKQSTRLAGSRFDRLVRSTARNIKLYHRKQMPRSKTFKNSHGASVGWLYRPVDRAGVYIPGGTAPLVSTALMTIVPARVAGVGEIVVCTPPGKDGEINPYILAACNLLGADTICRVGGAQAIAAMAFGTKSVPKVDTIVGPGNIYVTEAKRQLYGRVGIDMTAGPSEVVIIADGSADPAIIAVDLLSQAEHDIRSRAVLLATSKRLIDEVRGEMQRQLKKLPRRPLVLKAIRRGLELIRCRSLSEAVVMANRIAPEHLEIMTGNPEGLVQSIRNAGAIFVGTFSATALGDYVAGPSHVLPTGGTARYFSALSVNTFLKQMSYIKYDLPSIGKAAAAAERLAELEGLEAHAEAVRMRKRKSK